MEKFGNDLDVMNIVTTMNKTRVLAEALLDDNQKLMMNFSQTHTVNDEKSGNNDLDSILKYKCSKFKKKKAEFDYKIEGKH